MTHGGLKKGGCRGAGQVQGVTACPERPGVGGVTACPGSRRDTEDVAGLQGALSLPVLRSL